MMLGGDCFGDNAPSISTNNLFAFFVELKLRRIAKKPDTTLKKSNS